MHLTENSSLTLRRYYLDCPVKKNSSYPQKNYKSTNKSTPEASGWLVQQLILHKQTNTITSQDVTPVTARIAASAQWSIILSCCCTLTKAIKPHLTQTVPMEVTKLAANNTSGMIKTSTFVQQLAQCLLPFYQASAKSGILCCPHTEDQSTTLLANLWF